jgi:uncharacterized membrane protein
VSGWRMFKRHFLLGVLSVAPLAATAWVLVQFYGLVSRTVRPLLQRIPNLTESFPDFFLTLVAFLCFLVLIALVGLFARNLAGRAFFNLVERGFERIPLLKSVFSSSKQLAEVFFSDTRSAFREVVIFTYPRPGTYSLGFVTSASGPDGLVSVFVPTPPNPANGNLLVMPRSQFAVTSLSVEQGVNLIITCGAALTPAQAVRLRQDSERLPGAPPSGLEDAP